MITKSCKYCGKEFRVRNYRKDTAKFCSYECTGKYRYENNKKLRKAFTYDKSGPKHPMWNGGRNINTQGYVLIYSPDHPYKDKRSCVREHRLVMEKHLGRYLKPDENVHHKNGDKQDNRLENLELLTKNEHDKLHGKEASAYYESKRIKKVCPVCDKKFSVSKSLDRIECCSRSCSVKKRWQEEGLESFNRK
jgi:hypothetical protein